MYVLGLDAKEIFSTNGIHDYELYVPSIPIVCTSHLQQDNIKSICFGVTPVNKD